MNANTSLHVATSGPVDQALRARADKVIPGGMYGHLSTAINQMPPNFPQYFERGGGARLWDVDGRSYIDFMCSWGPMVLGHGGTVAEEAAHRQALQGDTLSGPGAVMVELAELLVDTVNSADWAIFAKNGTDATSTAVTIARAATGRKILLKAAHAYHGANAAFSPYLGGVTPEDRANIVEFTYNDLASLEAVSAANDGDVAAVILTPLQHDGFVDQELVDPEFARGARALCDRIGAALILDEVRTTMRVDIHGAWESIGVRPDLSCFSKAMGNGQPIAAVTGIDALRDALSTMYVTGSFWFSAVPMAASIATIKHMRDIDGTAQLVAAGERWRAGLAAQAEAGGVRVSLTGNPQMPQTRFVDDDESFTLSNLFCSVALDQGVFLHPWHNGFLSIAHTPDLIDEALQATEPAFAAVRSFLDAR